MGRRSAFVAVKTIAFAGYASVTLKFRQQMRAGDLLEPVPRLFLD